MIPVLASKEEALVCHDPCRSCHVSQIHHFGGWLCVEPRVQSEYVAHRQVW